MQSTKNLKKKLVQNFQFDSSNVKIIDGYEIINAKNILLNEVFTLKRLNLNDPQNKEKHQQMLRQISILKQLNGVNIIKCHKILKSKSNLYLVYDYFTGKNLNDLLQKNFEFIKVVKRIDKLALLKLQQDAVDMTMIQMIGKQLCQVLKQIQNSNIVHMRFIPSNVILMKNNLIKLANFTHAQVLGQVKEGKLTEQIQHDEYTDPFMQETQNIGFYTDIYSFGVILDKLYTIYSSSQQARREKYLQNLITGMTQRDPYKRTNLATVYQYFFGSKRQFQSKNRKNRNETYDKVSHKTQDKNSNKSITKSQKSARLSPVKNQRRQQRIRTTNLEKPTQKSIRTTRQIAKTANNANLEEKNLEKENRSTSELSAPRKSNDLIQTRKLEYFPDIESPANYYSPEPVQEPQENFKKITLNILKKRNLSALLLQLGHVVAIQVEGQCSLALQLAFLLYKKSLIQIVTLAKYLSKGSKRYIPDVSQLTRLKFSKTEDYYMLTKVINQQLQEQRNILVTISSLIKKQCPGLLKSSSPTTSVSRQNQGRVRQTYIPQLSEFQKQTKYETFNNAFLVTSIRKYLQLFLSDLKIINRNSSNAKQIFFWLNVLLEVAKYESYESFVHDYFEIEFDLPGKKALDKMENFRTLLKMSPRFVHLERMQPQELQNQLMEGLSQIK